MQQSVEDEGKINMVKDEHCSEIKVSESYQHLGHLNTIKSEPSVFGIQSGCDEGMNEKTDVSEDDVQDCKYFIQQSLEEEGKLWDSLHTISSKRIGIPEFPQHCDSNTLVKSEHSDFGIQSGSDERMNDKSDVSEDAIEDSKYFIQQSLHKEGQLWDSIDTTSSKEVRTIESSQNRAVESAQSGIGIHLGCDEIMDRETSESEDEDSKCFIVQYLDEEGKFCNNINTIPLKKEGSARELHENKLLEKEDANACELCDYIALSSDTLKRHINRAHRGQKIDKCQMNNDACAHRSEHMGSMHGELKNCKCNICDYCAPTENKLKRDNKGVKKKKKFDCDFCDYSAARVGHLNRHIDSVHLKARKHKCHLCDYSSAESGNLNRHVDSVHLKVKKHKCHFCDFSTAYSGSLKCHISDVHLDVDPKKEHKCHLCDYSSTSGRYLKCHIDSVHLKVNQHKCQLCDYSIAKTSDSNSHIDSVHLKLKTEKKHKCHLCEYSTTKNCDLSRHIDSVHLKLKREKKHECHLCGCSFTGSNNLKCHIDSVHLKLKKHKCHLCDYSTAYSSDLKCHIDSVHLKEKKYKCHLCDYSCSSNSNLRSHINSVHLKVKKHKCQLCDYSTTKRFHLNSHIDNVHQRINRINSYVNTILRRAK